MWDMTAPIQIIATSEVPEVERWRTALRTAVSELGGMTTLSAARQRLWLTSATYGWCDPTSDGAYVMYVMDADDDRDGAIFMCWDVISAGVWSDATIARIMRHALVHVIAGRHDHLQCSAMATMSSLECPAPDRFTADDVQFICSNGNVRSTVCVE